jgi:MFS transporter, DHA2 family, multidrug resistance protein
MLLDRGELKDWFNSTEIWVEAIVSGVCFYLFIVHTATTTSQSFINLDLVKSPNFMAGTVLMFFVGGILSGTLALLPTMLQSLMNYPVFTTGLVTAPRGVGTMIAMFLVGPMINRVDNRLIILAGFLLTVLSLWQMTGFSMQMGMGPVILSGLLQGFGLGCTFVPLNTPRAVEPAAAHPDARDGDAEPDAQPRRQHRHLDPRGAIDSEHSDRAFAPHRAITA